jgi:hypothetical protein
MELNWALKIIYMPFEFERVLDYENDIRFHRDDFRHLQRMSDKGVHFV